MDELVATLDILQVDVATMQRTRKRATPQPHPIAIISSRFYFAAAEKKGHFEGFVERAIHRECERGVAVWHQ